MNETPPASPLPTLPATATRSSARPRLNARPKQANSPRRWVSLAWKLGLAGLLIGLAGWGGWRWFLANSGQSDEVTATVTRGDLEVVVSERGELESAKTIDVRCLVEGEQIKIAEVLEEGVHLTKDQVVIRFNTDQLTRRCQEQEIKCKQADGKAKTAKEELEQAKLKGEKDTDKAEIDLKVADLAREKYLEGEYKVEVDDKKGAINLAQKELEEAQDKLTKYRDFVKKGFGTPEQLRAKELEVARAENNLERDKAKLMVLEKYTRQSQEVELTAKAKDARRDLERVKSVSASAIIKAQTDLEAADAVADLEKAALEHIKEQLDRCVVKSPAEGILVYNKERWWDASNGVRAGGIVSSQQVLFRLPELDHMQVKVKVNESKIKKIKVGQKVEIRVDAFPNTVLHGTAEFVSTLASSDTPRWLGGVKEYDTKVKIEDLPANSGVLPGMAAEVRIKVNQLNDVLTVPVQAVTQQENQHYAYVVGPKGIERRLVTVGENNEKFVEIREGLQEGEKVALDARARGAAEFKTTENKPAEKKPDETQKSPVGQ
jgi:RND family efflux transporter MFP subunit